MTVISWDAPPSGKPNHDWVAIVAELRTRPGEWAYVARYESYAAVGQIAQQLRAGVLAAAKPAGTVHATARKVDGEYRVYARYVGAS